MRDTIDSSAEDRIARWKEMGMISDADGDDSRTAAAKASKERKLSTIEGRFKQLASTEKNGALTLNASRGDAYKSAAAAYAKNAGIVKAKQEYISAMQAAATYAAKDAARAKLQAAKDAYFRGKGFSADEQKAIADYGDLSVSDNYGWSKNELLYAMQDGIVNSQPGTIDIVNNPNIIGKNITLTAKNGGIGYDDNSIYIKNADLTKAANMKLLASAKAGDLTWDENGVTIRRQVPLTLLSAAAGMDAYLHADNGIRMYDGYGMDMGYVRAGKLIDFYTKQGNIWDVRYLANGALVKNEAVFGNVRLIRVGGKLKIDDGVTGSGSGSGSGSSGGVVMKMKV